MTHLDWNPADVINFVGPLIERPRPCRINYTVAAVGCAMWGSLSAAADHLAVPLAVMEVLYVEVEAVRRAESDALRLRRLTASGMTTTVRLASRINNL